jgi:hypothetical protein
MSDESKQMFKFLGKMQLYKAEFPFQTVKGSSKVSLERNEKTQGSRHETNVQNIKNNTCAHKRIYCCKAML